MYVASIAHRRGLAISWWLVSGEACCTRSVATAKQFIRATNTGHNIRLHSVHTVRLQEFAPEILCNYCSWCWHGMCIKGFIVPNSIYAQIPTQAVRNWCICKYCAKQQQYFAIITIDITYPSAYNHFARYVKLIVFSVESHGSSLLFFCIQWVLCTLYSVRSTERG